MSGCRSHYGTGKSLVFLSHLLLLAQGTCALSGLASYVWVDQRYLHQQLQFLSSLDATMSQEVVSLLINRPRLCEAAGVVVRAVRCG